MTMLNPNSGSESGMDAAGSWLFGQFCSGLAEGLCGAVAATFEGVPTHVLGGFTSTLAGVVTDAVYVAVTPEMLDRINLAATGPVPPLATAESTAWAASQNAAANGGVYVPPLPPPSLSDLNDELEAFLAHLAGLADELELADDDDPRAMLDDGGWKL